MKLKQAILLVLLSSAGIVNAQTDFRPGYIVRVAGDTLYGMIDYRGDLFLGSTCRFKDSENSIDEYSPDDIIEFRFTDSKYFVSREINNRKVFLEFLIKGRVNMYYMRDDSGDHYYLEKDEMQLTEIPYKEGVKYVDDKPVFYESKIHIGILNYVMQDAPKLHKRIQSMKRPGHNNLIKLAEDYHNIVCNDEKCIIYEKVTPFIRILPEIAGGTIRYPDVEDLNDQLYMHAGVIGHIWMPRSNEKLYFRTGLLFSRVDMDNEKRSLFKVPCQLEYIYPKGIFRPRIAYGLNFYLPNARTVSLNFGGNVKLTDNLFLSLTSDIEFNSTMIIVPFDYLSHSLLLGLFLNY